MEPKSRSLTSAEQLAALSTLFPWIERFRQRPVRDYAATLYDAEPKVQCASRDHARQMIGTWLRQKARQKGFGDIDAECLRNEVLKHPVLQTGPHLHLAIDPDAFFTHLFSLMGLRAHGRRAYVSYNCSTVKLAQPGRRGPGWLKIQGEPINLFGISASKMTDVTLLARDRTYGFKLTTNERTPDLTHAVAGLKRMLPKSEFPSAALAIKCANDALWPSFFGSEINFLQLDDDDVSDLLVAHLDDPQSWVRSRFLNDPQLPAIMLKAIDRLASSPWSHWLRNTTHFFWGVNEHRLVPLTLEGRTLKSEQRQCESVPFNPDGLQRALLKRQIVPNLLLVFMLIAILPGIRILGGSRQSVYYPLMRYAFCSALVDHDEDDDLLRSVSHDKRASAWGHRVICDQTEPLALRLTGNIDRLLYHFGSLSLEEACGDLTDFRHDKLWSDLQAALVSGVATTKRSPWIFA